MLDLDLPIPDEPVPTLPSLPVETVYTVNAEFAADLAEDELYWARRNRKGQDVEPFVM